MSRWVEYTPLADLVVADVNPKRHDRVGIRSSMTTHGFASPLIVDERTGRLVAGHGRREVLIDLERRGGEPPAGVWVGDDGVWQVPVVRGWASEDDAEAAAVLVALNQLTAAGEWESNDLAALVDRVESSSVPLRSLGFARGELLELTRLADELSGVRETPTLWVTSPVDWDATTVDVDRRAVLLVECVDGERVEVEREGVAHGWVVLDAFVVVGRAGWSPVVRMQRHDAPLRSFEPGPTVVGNISEISSRLT